MLAWSGERYMPYYSCLALPKDKVAVSSSKRVLIDETRNQVFYYTKVRKSPKVWAHGEVWSLEREAEYAEELLREKQREHGVRQELLLLEAMHASSTPLLEYRDEWGTYTVKEEVSLRI
ncbi:hypothetical protein BASA81_000810 [Batrachochytrium salamandrivorans]|nr:hypothetical protein BASA81_000810 [Batrachochytrium salamandrivorans]